VSRAHTRIQDGLAGVDTLIRSILEVSHDMRLMTDRLAAAFSWFGETLKLKEESGGGPSLEIGTQAMDMLPEDGPGIEQLMEKPGAQIAMPSADPDPAAPAAQAAGRGGE